MRESEGVSRASRSERGRDAHVNEPQIQKQAGVLGGLSTALHLEPCTDEKCCLSTSQLLFFFSNQSKLLRNLCICPRVTAEEIFIPFTVIFPKITLLSVQAGEQSAY